ncbi:hypothetical protein CDD83_1213 [Cordyceps sp. RAO-2017]|nr:hypothetical protein CDD83_1213 [Cordyceps sp. RAO-2017]
MSEWPPKYLVPLCMTTSAPSANGSCSGGGAKVASTVRYAPAARALSAYRRRSRASPTGLSGVSTCTTSPGPSAPASQSSGSCSRPVSRASSRITPWQPW